MTNTLQQLSDRRAELQKQLAIEGRQLLGTEFRRLLGNNSHVQTITWRQYTPYFNDGEECVFEVHDYEDSILINNVDDWDETAETNALNRPIRQAVANLLNSVGEDTLKDVFGDHASVTYSNQGFEVEYYEHD